MLWEIDPAKMIPIETINFKNSEGNFYSLKKARVCGQLVQVVLKFDDSLSLITYDVASKNIRSVKPIADDVYQ